MAGGRSFDRQKVLAGLLKACEKRPVAMGKLADDCRCRWKGRLSDFRSGKSVPPKMGEMLMEHLQQLDKIAYVRFASVYRDFQDVEAFLNELKHLGIQKRS